MSNVADNGRWSCPHQREKAAVKAGKESAVSIAVAPKYGIACVLTTLLTSFARWWAREGGLRTDRSLGSSNVAHFRVEGCVGNTRRL